MPTAVGPFSFSTRFHCRAISSKAWSQETGWNSPSLANRAVAHAQQRRGEPVGAVHDLGEEVALDAVEAAVDLGLHVAVGGDDLAVLDPDHDAAAGRWPSSRRLRWEHRAARGVRPRAGAARTALDSHHAQRPAAAERADRALRARGRVRPGDAFPQSLAAFRRGGEEPAAGSSCDHGASGRSAGRPGRAEHELPHPDQKADECRPRRRR